MSPGLPKGYYYYYSILLLLLLLFYFILFCMIFEVGVVLVA